MNYQKLFDHMFQEHGLTLTEGQMQDIIHEVNSLQSKGKTDASKLKDEDREMEGNLSVLIGSEIAIINKGIKSEIDWRMISEWITRKINPKQESKGKTKEEVWRITAENKFPICYKTGDWDGKQSDLCLCVDAEGKHHLATCYESNREFEWYDKNDFGLRHDVVKWAYVESIEEYASQQPEAMKEGWVSVDYVSQKDRFGCVVACLAMVVGKSYDEVKAEFVNNDFSKQGISMDFHGCSFLEEHGYFTKVLWPTVGYTQEKREDWMRPFAPIHIVRVPNSHGNSHAVVMKENGDILDPYRAGTYKFSDYTVEGMIGIWKMPLPPKPQR